MVINEAQHASQRDAAPSPTEMGIITEGDEDAAGKRLDRHDEALTRLRQENRHLRDEINDLADEALSRINEVANDMNAELCELRNRVEMLEATVDHQAQVLRQHGINMETLVDILIGQNGNGTGTQ